MIAVMATGNVVVTGIVTMALVIVIVAVIWAIAWCAQADKPGYVSRRKARLELDKAEIEARVRLAEAEARRFEAASQVVAER